MITKPLLPPKSGYVEVVNENGEHVYKAINAVVETEQSKILARLSAIDTEEIRPLAAIANGTGTQTDTDKLAELEAEKATLRAELATINAAGSEEMAE